ncbi:MAG: hypothetical protein IJ566_02295 [Cardiobacteriaceae bacterium]|nr:hypothetical protein [Cardiobacteriaceae bacterium]
MSKFKIFSYRSIYGDLATYDPRLDPHRFEIYNEWLVPIGFTIGSNEKDDHCFELQVCSAEFIARHTPTWGRFRLILADWDLEEIIYSVEEIIKECCEIINEQHIPAEQVYKNLSRYMEWEFEPVNIIHLT